MHYVVVIIIDYHYIPKLTLHRFQSFVIAYAATTYRKQLTFNMIAQRTTHHVRAHLGGVEHHTPALEGLHLLAHTEQSTGLRGMDHT